MRGIKKTLHKEGFSIYQQNVHLLSFSQIRVRCWYCIRTFFTFGSTTQINGSTIATFLAILENKPVAADTFFFYEVIDHSVHPIPAELLFLLCRVAIANNYNLAFRVIAHASTNACKQTLCIRTQGNCLARESNAW